MNWTCKKIKLCVEPYLEGWLSVRDTAAYKAHVDTCPDCRDFFGREAPGVDKTAPKTWTCRKIELFHDDYLEETLSVQDRFTYDAHLETCPSCREYVNRMTAFVEKLKGEIGPGIRAAARQMPEKMRQRVSEALAELSIEEQILLAEAIRGELEEEDRRLKDWLEKVRRRREPVKPI